MYLEQLIEWEVQREPKTQGCGWIRKSHGRYVQVVPVVEVVET